MFDKAASTCRCKLQDNFNDEIYESGANLDLGPLSAVQSWESIGMGASSQGPRALSLEAGCSIGLARWASSCSQQLSCADSLDPPRCGAIRGKVAVLLLHAKVNGDYHDLRSIFEADLLNDLMQVFLSAEATEEVCKYKPSDVQYSCLLCKPNLVKCAPPLCWGQGEPT